MLKKLENIPSYVAGFKATAEVSKDDYDNILKPEIERIDEQHGHIHFIMVLETPAKQFTFSAWMQDAIQGLKHYRGWKKVAIVSDETWIDTVSSTFSAFIPGESKGFKLSELEQAKQWVALEN